nr:SIS domain-containing protein [Streptomonospora nanhaiensis]
MEFDESRLEDPRAGADALRGLASAAARVRSARTAAAEADLDVLALDGRPRAVVVLGAGAAAAVGDICAAALGPGCPVPVVPVRGYRLPGWVGGPDLVVAVAPSAPPAPGGPSDPAAGASTIGQISPSHAAVAACAAEAARRGCRFLAIGPAGGPLAAVAERSRAPSIALPQVGGPPESPLGPVVALLTAVSRVGVSGPPEGAYDALAERLERAAMAYGPSVETWDNPAKSAALDIAGSIPVISGGTPAAQAAADHWVSRLASVARYPAVRGGSPELLGDHISLVGGPFGGTGPRSIFDDPVEDGAVGLRLVLLRDPEEVPEAARDLALAADTAREQGVEVSEYTADEGGPLERTAGLIALTDYATVYVAVAYGTDPLAHTLVVR